MHSLLEDKLIRSPLYLHQLVDNVMHAFPLIKIILLGVSVSARCTLRSRSPQEECYSSGKPSFTNSVFVFQTIADIIRTCLGPKAMLKVSFLSAVVSGHVGVFTAIQLVFNTFRNTIIVA